MDTPKVDAQDSKRLSAQSPKVGGPSRRPKGSGVCRDTCLRLVGTRYKL